MENLKLRYNFPKENGQIGYSKDFIFHKDKVEGSYNEMKLFLRTEGYENIPIPQDADEFYLTRGEDADTPAYSHFPIYVSTSAHDGNVIVLTILNENFPNILLLSKGGNAHDERLNLKKHRINCAIDFVEEAAKNKEFSEGFTSIERLREISEILLELRYDKITIIGGLLQNAFTHELFTLQEVEDEFGDEVGKVMNNCSYNVF